MSTVTRPKGPLPARVYWVRRLLVLAAALALVVGLARLLGGGGGGDPVSAVPVAGAASPTSTGPTTTTARGTSPPSAPAPSTAPTTASGAGEKPRHRGTEPAGEGEPARLQTPLAVPTGPCDDSDVQVTPAVHRAHAGSDVRIVLKLSTREAPACTWTVSPRSVVVRLTSGDDRIWSTQDCPRAVEKKSVVLRNDQVTRAYVTWKGQRSDGTCSASTPWAMPGYYHAQAAALGSDPVDEQFRLLSVVPRTLPPSPTPTPEEKKSRRDHGGTDHAGSDHPDQQQTDRPGGTKTD